MIITTTQSIEGQTIREYKGIVVGEAIMGANIVRDFFASITDVMADARQIAEQELADAVVAVVVGVDLDYEDLLAKACSWCPCPMEFACCRNFT